jgi:hypothetical protein
VGSSLTPPGSDGSTSLARPKSRTCTALVRPDHPELLKWPCLWQQTQYVLGGGTTDYLILALAADHLREDP